MKITAKLDNYIDNATIHKVCKYIIAKMQKVSPEKRADFFFNEGLIHKIGDITIKGKEIEIVLASNSSELGSMTAHEHYGQISINPIYLSGLFSKDDLKIDHFHRAYSNLFLLVSHEISHVFDSPHDNEQYEDVEGEQYYQNILEQNAFTRSIIKILQEEYAKNNISKEDIESIKRGNFNELIQMLQARSTIMGLGSNEGTIEFLETTSKNNELKKRLLKNLSINL